MSALMNAQQNKKVHSEDHIGRMLINGFPGIPEFQAANSGPSKSVGRMQICFEDISLP